MMDEQLNIQEIVETLRAKGIIESEARVLDERKGTTDGLVYTLTVGEEPKYVLKIDRPESNAYVERLLLTYQSSPLLPDLLYLDPSKRYMAYPYVEGTTHFNRGSKRDCMKRLVEGLLNVYRPHPSGEWGRLEYPRGSWREFNERSFEGTRPHVSELLPSEDHDRVYALIERVSDTEDKSLLHGDTGVHNFVYREEELVGIIDPSPMLGPVIYDFTYAYCSSPDDLDLDTLLAAFELLRDPKVDRARLIEEVVFQLYCRIGICARVHPHDLEDYLKAWDYWRTHLA